MWSNDCELLQFIRFKLIINEHHSRSHGGVFPREPLLVDFLQYPAPRLNPSAKQSSAQRGINLQGGNSQERICLYGPNNPQGGNIPTGGNIPMGRNNSSIAEDLKLSVVQLPASAPAPPIQINEHHSRSHGGVFPRGPLLVEFLQYPAPRQKYPYAKESSAQRGINLQGGNPLERNCLYGPNDPQGGNIPTGGNIPSGGNISSIGEDLKLRVVQLPGSAPAPPIQNVYDQHGRQHQGYPPPGYPPGPPQQMYPQQGYGQGYPPPGYPPPPQGYPQPGYPQPGYPQPGYPQPAYPPPQPAPQPPQSSMAQSACCGALGACFSCLLCSWCQNAIGGAIGDGHYGAGGAPGAPTENPPPAGSPTDAPKETADTANDSGWDGGDDDD